VLATEDAAFGAESPAFLGEGWLSAVYRLGGGLCAKFPKRALTWPDLAREIAFLGAVPPLPIRVVEHLRHARRSAGAPFGWAIFREVPGAALDAGVASHGAVAERLGAFLRALHQLTPDPRIARMLPRQEPRDDVIETYEAAKRLVLPELSARERDALDVEMRSFMGDAANFANAPCVLHADLSADHILHVDGQVTGVIDWGDVCFGDPDYDFSYLYQDFGAGFVRRMADAYGHQDRERLVHKARFYTIADQVGTLAQADIALPGDVADSWRLLHELLR